MGANDDADVTNDPSDPTFAAGVGGYDVLRLDPVNDPPLVSDLYGLGQSGAKVAQGEWGELYSVLGDVGDLGFNALIYVADPLNYLLSAGLGFLIDVIQPLEDLIGLVTGNGERMGDEITKWNRVGAALGPLAQEIRAAADEGLLGWQGKAADAARVRLHSFADGVDSLTNDVKQVGMILGIAKTLMETAEQLVVSFIATFVEWLIYTWVPALAAAVPTAGASTAAAGAATAVEATTTTARIVSFIDRVVIVLKRLRLIITRMHPRIMKRVQSNFQLRNGGQFAKGWISTPHALGNTARDWRTWAQPGLKLGVNGAQDATAVAGQPHQPAMNWDQEDQALDGNR
jgi:hypothetical protein